MLLLNYCNYQWLEASVISSILSTLVGYFLSIIFVFQSGSRYKIHQEIFGVLVISFFAFILHQALMYFFIEVLKVNFIFSKIISIGIIFLFNYFSRSKFIFSSFKN
jgi:putative flippase GtrA